MITVTIKREGLNGARTFVRVTAESIERALTLCSGEVVFPLSTEEFFSKSSERRVEIAEEVEA